ncbi:uncharacterized protein LOC122312626 [Carya illinoinensis]|uniref:uncharacterized protein LOC122312626 n=1 Tax=Carya illinoinensis TaxID=32201 RepID=UPI001C7259BC|nr:uncharacterized protein LOC122312626 [Carya illinoinensis]
MDRFQDAINKCGLFDMGYIGNKFTWNNGRQRPAFIKERLDRAFCNERWSDQNNDARVHALSTLNSDHSPLWITYDQLPRPGTSVTKPFKFEAKWLLDDECYQQVETSWKTHRIARGKMDYMTTGLQLCKEQLTQWSGKRFENTRREIKGKMDALAQLQNRNSRQLTEQIRHLQRDIDTILEVKNIKWKQRAKKKWLKEGDRNTKFFHQAATQRRKTNLIRRKENKPH